MSGTAVPRGAISGRPTWGDAALLVTISSIGPFAANTYVPGFHAIAESLGTDLVAVQQSLSLYLIVFAVASLFVGALSDALGRKPVIVGGMLLFVVSSVAAMMSTSIEWLYACRVLQGVAASVGPVVTQAVVRDRWSGENAARVLALMTVLFGLAPAAAPIIGGWITVHFGWRGIFLFLAVLNLTLAALAHFKLPETHPKENRRAFSVVGTAAPYGQAVRHPAFMAGVIGHGFTFMGGIVYSAGAADFVINIMGMGVDDFGWLVVPLIVCTMLGGWAGPRLLRRLGPWPLLAWGISVMTADGGGLGRDRARLGGCPRVSVASRLPDDLPLQHGGRAPRHERDEPRLLPEESRDGGFDPAVLPDDGLCGGVRGAGPDRAGRSLALQRGDGGGGGAHGVALDRGEAPPGGGGRRRVSFQGSRTYEERQAVMTSAAALSLWRPNFRVIRSAPRNPEWAFCAPLCYRPHPRCLS